MRSNHIGMVAYYAILLILLSACAPAPAPVPTTTITPAPTATPKPKIFELKVFVFHDFNANEKYDESLGEIPLENIQITIDGNTCSSKFDGICKIEYLEGTNKIIVNSENTLEENMNYVFYENKVFKIRNRITFNLKKGNRVDLGLGQGPFAIPLMESSIGHYFDGVGNYGRLGPDGTHHYAVDIRIVGDEPQPVFAVVEGEIGEEPFGDCNNIVIYVRGNYGDFNINTGHLTEVTVKPNQHVKKGDLIGFIDPLLYQNNINGVNEKGELDYSGPNLAACTNNPHLHIGIYGPGGKEGENGWGWLNILELFAKSNEFYAMKE